MLGTVFPMKARLIITARLLVLIIVIELWEILALLSPRLQFAIASPTLILPEIVDLLRYGQIAPHFIATGGAALLGLIGGTTVGTILGLTTWFSKTTSEMLKPFILVLGAVPILAVAPLMIIWFGIGFWMKVGIASLSTIFVAFAQSSRGAQSVSTNYIEVLRGMNAGGTDIFVKAVIPGSLDWVFSAMRLNAGFALLGTFIGEFIASNVGLGHLVLKASNLYNVPRAIAASIFITVLALIFDGLATFLEKHRNQVIMILCIPRQAWKSRQ